MPIPSRSEVLARREKTELFPPGDSAGLTHGSPPDPISPAEAEATRRMIATLALHNEDEWLQLAAQKSFRSFNQRTYTNYIRSHHIDVLNAALEKAIETPNYRLIITMPPRHSKSVHVSEHDPMMR